MKQKGSSVTRIISILGSAIEFNRVIVAALGAYLDFWEGNFQQKIRAIILQDIFAQDPFLSAFAAVSFFPDGTQHSYSLRKATVLKLAKPFYFNFTLCQSEKYIWKGNF